MYVRVGSSVPPLHLLLALQTLLLRGTSRPAVLSLWLNLLLLLLLRRLLRCLILHLHLLLLLCVCLLQQLLTRLLCFLKLDVKLYAVCH